VDGRGGQVRVATGSLIQDQSGQTEGEERLRQLQVTRPSDARECSPPYQAKNRPAHWVERGGTAAAGFDRRYERNRADVYRALDSRFRAIGASDRPAASGVLCEARSWIQRRHRRRYRGPVSRRSWMRPGEWLGQPRWAADRPRPWGTPPRTRVRRSRSSTGQREIA
jgi:hypothetical protein